MLKKLLQLVKYKFIFVKDIYIYTFQNVAQPECIAESSLATWLSLASLAALSMPMLSHIPHNVHPG
jgi:hypothetical protein